ncbi:PGPGW domain-containing protein [Salinimonas sediminis]|uniref:Tellurium resistance protein TerC n=1 Tax=Salinimonas sediminis TaxID=2303538 RepID=A0A346NMU8_9ALTE|nr:PGPGW domain-containing protein [Salinimonas sediminis]AXR06855.1 tellurium resistance protein TerC [Salinimonas sediminis]
MRIIRLTVGGLLFIAGIVLTLLPGSILLVVSGLVILSYDWPRARSWLGFCQRSMRHSALKIDRYLLARKLR